MTKEALDTLAKEVTLTIAKDIHMRSGLGAAWRMIDPVMKEEIFKSWSLDVAKVIEPHFKLTPPVGGKQ